jgi:hypothetical protein
MMTIKGRCHCGNIRFALDWPGDASAIAVRECGCSFCAMRGGIYASHPEAKLRATLADASLVSRYRFGTGTAEFHVCARCGAVPFVTSEIAGRLYAVVNAGTFEGIERTALRRAPADFEGEDVAARLARRARTWIPEVSIERRAP